MSKSSTNRQIALVGSYPPRRCGIATFTHDLWRAISACAPLGVSVVAVNDLKVGYDYGDEVCFELLEQDLDTYRRAATFLNFRGIDVVSLQHEFGIFGGPAGRHVLTLLENLRMPVVATLHTVLDSPNDDQRAVMHGLKQHCTRFVVMSERGRQQLQKVYDLDPSRIDLIPHGIPDVPFVDSNFDKTDLGWQGKYVALTFGLLSPDKGIETVLRALPAICQAVDNFVYVVLGSTHPALLRHEGERYRQSLEALASELGVRSQVQFHNRFVEPEELQKHINAADLYITPYLNPAQITSGALSYAFGSGKAVVSTPYRHAEELLADGRGVLVPFADAVRLATEVIALLRDEPRRQQIRQRAYQHSRGMIWSRTAEAYADSFAQALQPLRSLVPPPLHEPTTKVASQPLCVDHLRRMTDSTGMFQHAHYTFPRFVDGYCTDDNARALLLAVLAQEVDDHPYLQELARNCAAFLDYAFEPKIGRFRNFLSFERRWLEEVGSNDSQGRALWSLGAIVGRSRYRNLMLWADHLLQRMLPGFLPNDSPRAWCFALLGLHEYLRRPGHPGSAIDLRDTLLDRLKELYRQQTTTAQHAAPWLWPEPHLAYDNARIPQALLVSGEDRDDRQAIDMGLQSMRWLLQLQTAETGHFRPIGSDGYHRRGGDPARFDQLPLEATATVSACCVAYRITQEKYFADQARTAFQWFLGRNDLSVPLYDPNTGGCRDGLHIDRSNRNQGAESTLSFWLAWTEMRRHHL